MRVGMRALIASLLVVTAPAIGAAQPLGYAVAGPAGFSGFFGSRGSGHVAGGGEFLVAGLVGPQAEFGFFDRLLTLSINGVVHLADPRTQKVSPFLTGGYTRMGIGEGEALDEWNVAGGVDVWFKRHVGLRTEFRDHVRPDRRGTVQYWSLRAGVVFR